MKIKYWWKWIASLLTIVFSEANFIPNVTTLAPSITQEDIPSAELLTSDWTTILEEYEDITNSSTLEDILGSTLSTTSENIRQHSTIVNNTYFTTIPPSPGTQSISETGISSRNSEPRSTEAVNSEPMSTVTRRNTTTVSNDTLPPSTAGQVTEITTKTSNTTLSTEKVYAERSTIYTDDTNIENKNKGVKSNHPVTRKNTHVSRNRVINNVAVWITSGFVVVILAYIIGLVVCNRQRTEWRLQMRRYVRFENGTEPDFQADRDCYNQNDCGTNIFTEEEKNSQR